MSSFESVDASLQFARQGMHIKTLALAVFRVEHADSEMRGARDSPNMFLILGPARVDPASAARVSASPTIQAACKHTSAELDIKTA